MKKKSLAVITARGGSKRIPHKNIKEFCGKPIIAYSIEAALKSEIFDEVMVSTDDEEIKKIAIEYGAKIPFMRSEKTSNDYAATHEVLLEVLDEYKKMDIYFEYMCCIYPTAPFVDDTKLKKAFEKLNESDVDLVYPIVSYSFPPQRAVKLVDGHAEFLKPENMFVRSQDLEKIYHDCGQFYFLNVASFEKERKLILDKNSPLIVDELEMQDIDNIEDWKLAELKYKLLKGKIWLKFL